MDLRVLPVGFHAQYAQATAINVTSRYHVDVNTIFLCFFPGVADGISTVNQCNKMNHFIQQVRCRYSSRKLKIKIYSSRDSLLVTHATTNPPVKFLNMDERTGILILTCLWPYMMEEHSFIHYVDSSLTLCHVLCNVDKTAVQ